MTTADDFIADCKGKSLGEIKDIQQGYFEDGLLDGDSGTWLYDPVHVICKPYALENVHDYFSECITIYGEPLFDWLGHDASFNIEKKVWEYLSEDSSLDIIPGSYGDDEEGNVTAWAERREGLDGIGEGTCVDFDIEVSPEIAKKIMDEKDIYIDNPVEKWAIGFHRHLENELDTSVWNFTDGSTCDWDDLQ